MTLLKIPIAYTNRDERGFFFAYAKYKQYIEASSKLRSIVADGHQPVGFKRVSAVDLIEVFISKTSWYDSYTLFDGVANYEAMQKWLNNDEDQLSDAEVWGKIQGTYIFQDLKEWLSKK